VAAFWITTINGEAPVNHNDNKEQFAKRHRLGILSTLRDLIKREAVLGVHHPRGQLISKVLELHDDDNRFIFDLGSQEQENQLALLAETLTFSAEPSSAKVEFNTGRIEQIMYQGLPAFSAQIPDVIYVIQRREFFRVNVPFEADYNCHGVWPDSAEFSYKLKDVSLGGLGVQTESNNMLSDSIKQGTIIENANIELGEYGSFTIDLQFVGAIKFHSVNNKGETITFQRLGFRFPYLSASHERTLQRAIIDIERQQNQRNLSIR
jgi:c-di-GMP-binding flagellar brake protein YcgR